MRTVVRSRALVLKAARWSCTAGRTSRTAWWKSDTRCAREACSKEPSFGLEGGKAALYCNKHAKDGIVDVKNRRYPHRGCSKQQSFDAEGSKVVLYGRKHAEDGMVVNQRCVPDTFGEEVNEISGAGLVLDAETFTMCLNHGYHGVKRRGTRNCRRQRVVSASEKTLGSDCDERFSSKRVRRTEKGVG